MENTVVEARPKHSFFVAVIGVSLLVLMVGILCFMNMHKSERTAYLNNLNAQLDALNAENKDIEYLLNENDEAVLYERLARERGYVYADEKVYYNLTPGA